MLGIAIEVRHDVHVFEGSVGGGSASVQIKILGRKDGFRSDRLVGGCRLETGSDANR